MSDNSGVFPGFPSPSPITYTNTTSDPNNALGFQLFDNSGLFATSLNPSPITYTTTNNTPSDGNAFGLQFSAVSPVPTSSGDKAKPKARSSAHATNTNSIKESSKEKKKHAEGYKRKSMSCEHCRQRRKPCDGTDFNACTRCTCDGIDCKYVLAKGKRGSQKAFKQLAAMGRAPSADGIIIATPSTSSLASSSGTSSMSPITPITPVTPARSTVELSSGPFSLNISGGLTSGFATPHIFMPFVPPTQAQPPISQLSSTVDSNGLGLLPGWQIAELQQALLDRVGRCLSDSAAAPAASEFVPYEPPTPRTTPVKPTYVRPTDVSPVQAPAFSLSNANASVPSTLPAAAMDITQPQSQLPALEPQTLSESDRLQLKTLAMEIVFGDGSFAAPPEAPEDEEDVDWGMYVNMEEMEQVDDSGSLGARAVMEAPFSTASFEVNARPFEATDRDMRGLWS
ncbi:hypothetical protein B9479_006456 [Cryptococcus floricola]|uniref:Zn(2)-C6 fungal-type domain-containing protein n=1 Tax=Cryptococcus floricola TaxID=2591691 RepID=A0A5D3AQ35_9TREE|nr:hypothetical protein B9479_006456 [Cryptococcus floricola]